jgi:MFS family permease
MLMSATEPHIDDVIARSNVVRLAIAQALSGANSIVIMTTGAIIGSILAPSALYATVPVSIYIVGTALSTLLAGRIARRYGRKRAFFLGTLAGMIVAVGASLAIWLGSFALFCASTFIGGFYQAVAQSLRFAATDTASPAFRPKAISWVMAGGVFAGVLGPQLVNITMNLWSPYLFMASFAAQGGVALVCMIILAGTDLPKPVIKQEEDRGRPLPEIIKQPKFIVAAFSGVVSYALMNLLMTSAPLAMKMCGLTLSDANWGIQWHVIAMYLPSFWTGSVVQRFGPAKVILVGFSLIACASLVNLAGQTAFHFWGGLILLGVGWNFGFVGASALVVETHQPQERTRVQSFNDFLIFGTNAIASFSSGTLLVRSGWDTVNYLIIPALCVAVVLLLSRHHDLKLTSHQT